MTVQTRVKVFPTSVRRLSGLHRSPGASSTEGPRDPRSGPGRHSSGPVDTTRLQYGPWLTRSRHVVLLLRSGVFGVHSECHVSRPLTWGEVSSGGSDREAGKDPWWTTKHKNLKERMNLTSVLKRVVLILGLRLFGCSLRNFSRTALEGRCSVRGLLSRFGRRGEGSWLGIIHS